MADALSARNGYIVAKFEVLLHVAVPRTLLHLQREIQIDRSGFLLYAQVDLIPELVPCDDAQDPALTGAHRDAFSIGEVAEHGHTMVNAEVVDCGAHCSDEDREVQETQGTEAETLSEMYISILP